MIAPFDKKNSIRRGYIALLSVIVIGTIGVAVMMSVLLFGISSSKTDYALQQGGSAKIVANSCGEEALQRLLETGSTSMSGGLSIASGTCSYVVSSPSGQDVVLEIVGQYGETVSKIRVIVATTTPFIILSSWQDVGDF
ncbi:MAG: hypothetical protein QG653_200 [Patescibacteria group bacterium]|nr:hypothetical protein [Patescibacteria group bacterium]